MHFNQNKSMISRSIIDATQKTILFNYLSLFPWMLVVSTCGNILNQTISLLSTYLLCVQEEIPLDPDNFCISVNGNCYKEQQMSWMSLVS